MALRMARSTPIGFSSVFDFFSNVQTWILILDFGDFDFEIQKHMWYKLACACVGLFAVVGAESCGGVLRRGKVAHGSRRWLLGSRLGRSTICLAADLKSRSGGGSNDVEGWHDDVG